MTPVINLFSEKLVAYMNSDETLDYTGVTVGKWRLVFMRWLDVIDNTRLLAWF